ncbi:amidase [Falsiroseomonas tokyonensis]|uniref:Amidase n=1 Tax=Falsiroseomonas tokyonensis TaxID=430521 RepID=A0ABV7BQ59_9PROT|nr:amidase [Falsiroseomonas tokyonensis]MBU8536789.1 amidase [Falsiroseomonas tokyonensis]
MTPEQIRASAFVAHGDIRIEGAPSGPLAGLTFAAKDLFDVAGTRSGWGNPDRLRDAPVSLTTASALLPALDAGATLIGKTHTDEIASGLFGENPHYGAPINPRAPDRVPGGSSSGSASAVAGGLCDFAFGTDTGGSVRVPSSFCGLYGIRTTHGRVSVAGVMPMAPSIDTVGWFARDAALLRRIGEVFFGPAPATAPRLLIAEDAFEIPQPTLGAALRDAAQGLGAAQSVTLYEEGAAHWLDTFRPLQLGELWTTHGTWAREPGRRLSPAVADRLELAATVTPQAIATAWRERERLTARLHALLGTDGVLILPTAHDLPPLRDAPVSAQMAFRDRTLALTCVASLCRLPQVNIPAGTLDGIPIGLSLIGGSYQDAALLAAAETLGARLA